MNKRTLLSLAILGLVGTSSHTVAQEHAAAPMLKQPPKREMPTGPSLVEMRSDILTQFESSYSTAGKPAIAVFWNRKFDDQLSQWYQTVRFSQTGESAIKGSDKFEPQGGDQAAYERNVSGGGKIVSAQYLETRAGKQTRRGFDESTGFEFSAGFTSTFLQVPAKIIDRDAIMRLVQRDNAKQAGAEMISDYQKIETDSLMGYADYLAEVLLTPDSRGDTGWAFMVTVKSVKDGSVIAMFKSPANVPMDGPPKEYWTTTANGYEKVVEQRQIGTPTDVGEQLAFETMQALSRIWK